MKRKEKEEKKREEMKRRRKKRQSLRWMSMKLTQEQLSVMSPEPRMFRLTSQQNLVKEICQ